MPLVFFELDDINWYPSATPYQRACALTDIGEVFLMGPAVSIDGDLQSKVGLLPVRVSPRSHSFARVSGWVSPANVDSYARAAQSVLSECRYPVWICSTNVWVQRLAAGLKGRLGGCILVDVFDPVEFPREVAVLKRHWLSASWYWVKEHGAIRLLRHADIAIRATALDLTKEYGVSPDRIVAVLNGVRPSLLTHGLSAPVESSGLSTSETVKLGYVGQLDIQRGLGSFCSVVETLRRRGNRIEVHMVGPIAKGDEAVLASRFDPDGLWLHFRGPLKTDVAMDVLSACDILVDFRPDLHFSRCQYPIKIGEYLALGKPIVASNLPGIREMVGPELAKSLVPAGDEAAWVHAIENMIQHPREIAKLRALALARAQEIAWPRVHNDLLLRLKKVEEELQQCRI